jgi:tetratricopeptide (TPR) repeat protein
MKVSFRHFLLCIFSAALFSCAPPSPEFEKQEFVPKRDILANSYYREGADMYKAGRMMDAEMRMRQALYLFPEADNIKSSLALVLKSSGLYDEANSIYKELIKRYPEAYDYQFALADSYYRERRFEDAAVVFKKAMAGYELLPDIGKASQAARSLASIYFLEGEEIKALCSSSEAFTYSAAADQAVRHIRLLLAAGDYGTAEQVIAPLIEKTSDVKDPSLLKLAALVFIGTGNIPETKKYLDLAYENQTAGLKDADAELGMIRRLIDFKYPDENADTDEEAEEKKKEKDEEKTIVFNEENLLYWPVPLVNIYYEYLKQLTFTE